MIIAIPTKQSAAPMVSNRSGLIPSIAHLGSAFVILLKGRAPRTLGYGGLGLQQSGGPTKLVGKTERGRAIWPHSTETGSN
jgi:hypothetical protein